MKMPTNSLPEPVFLSAPKAATLCGVSRNTICCWIRDGKMPSYRTAGGKYLIRPDELVNFMHTNGMFVPQSLLDIAKTEPKGITPAPGTHKLPLGNEPKILVVDDDIAARDLAVRSLESCKLPILVAENGYEALHLLTKHPEIALVVLDLVMPGQDGVKTFAEIKKTNKSLPVIVVTGYPPESAQQTFGGLEPDLIITKPYAPDHLQGAAAAYLADLGI